MNYKKLIPDLLAILFFVAISIAYFWQPIQGGLVLTGSDHNAAIGSNVEMEQYRATHNGERTRWTNTLFCGMPTYQMSPSYPSTETLSSIEDAYQLWLPTVAGYVFMMLLGFYIMLRAFDFKAWMAALGAVLWAFSSYYFIIIAAGHIWKLLTLCFIPPTIAGVVLCYRGKYLWGMVVTGIFTALQIFSNHVQMSYYFLSVMLLMVIAYLIDAIRQHKMTAWLKASGAAAVGGLLGICVNLSNLYHTYEYSKESMRGKSELTQKVKNAEDQTDSGLERSYITAWSYGLDETWTLMIPNTKGGATMPLVQSKEAMEHADSQYISLYQQMYQYWGDQPMTSGPVYIGAFVCFLFILGLLIVRGPMKWCLLIATILSILLSWGKNFMPFTDFFLDYVPMYSKFRTVASILVIAEFTMPLLGMLALKTLVDEKDKEERKLWIRNSLFISLALTGGVCLLFWMMPDLFFGNYVSAQEFDALSGLVQGGVPQNVVDDILGNIHDMRSAVFTADCMRSLVVILIGFAALMAWRWGKIGEISMVVCVTLVCLVDMWGVNKRYLNDGMFVFPRSPQQAFQKTQADEMILEDQTPYYRVLNLSVSTFNDNTTSYYHKSIGGYHAAKLRRYQELVDEHLQGEMARVQNAAFETQGRLDSVNGNALFPVLNMLNMKYLIVGLKDGGRIPIQNVWANGNAWFVQQVKYVEDADAEIKKMHGFDSKHVAIADQRFYETLGTATNDTTGKATLTKYGANELEYDVESNEGGVLVFSEIYYPGWTCEVDGKAVEIGRVNYVLRAIRIEGGKHHIVMRFDPQTVHTTEAIAYTALALMALLLIALVAIEIKKKKA